MSKAKERIEELVDYFQSAGGVVRGGSLADVEDCLKELGLERQEVGKQIWRDLQKEMTHGLLLVAERNEKVVGMGLGYEQDDCYWVNDVVTSGKARGAGVTLMREFAKRAQEAGKELRLQALQSGGSLGFYDMLGARTVDHYNKRALGWKKAGLSVLAGEKVVEAPAL